MKIAIDVSQIIYGTGVSYYTESLITTLLSIDKTSEYVLFGTSLRRFYELNKTLEKYKSRNVKITTLPIPPTLLELFWNRLHIVPMDVLIGRIDIVHTSDWTEPPSMARKVTTVHDLSPFKFPKFTSKTTIDVHRRKLRWSLKESSAVIVPSQSTKDDLVEFGFKEQIIYVIPEAAGLEFKKYSDESVKKTLQKYNLREKYLITIGVGGRKNTENLIKAFEYAKVGNDIKLVLVGGGGEKYESFRGVKALGRIEDRVELAHLINGAESLVYPSFYEGFGLPILQAFACGCPVITSNVSSMAEIASGAAVLVDPYSADSIALGIATVLKKRQDYISKGLERAKKFSWEKAAQETLKVYTQMFA